MVVVPATASRCCFALLLSFAPVGAVWMDGWIGRQVSALVALGSVGWGWTLPKSHHISIQLLLGAGTHKSLPNQRSQSTGASGCESIDDQADSWGNGTVRSTQARQSAPITGQVMLFALVPSCSSSASRLRSKQAASVAVSEGARSPHPRLDQCSRIRRPLLLDRSMDPYTHTRSTRPSINLISRRRFQPPRVQEPCVG